MNNKKIRDIYDAMSRYYNMTQDFDTFAESMEEEEYAKKVYGAMSQHYNMTQDYDTFRGSMMDGDTPSAPSAPSAEEIAEGMKQPTYLMDKMKSSASHNPTPLIEEYGEGEEKAVGADSEKEDGDDMTPQDLTEIYEEIGYVDALKRAKRDAKKDKRVSGFRAGLMAMANADRKSVV